MERGLDVPEQSRGDAAEGAQPAPTDPGDGDAAVEAAAPEQVEATAPEEVADAEVEAAADDPAPETVASAAAEPVAVEAAVPADDGGAAQAETVEAAAPPAPEEPVPDAGPPRKRMLTGNVVSDKGHRTIVVSIAHRKKHRLYKKYITLSKKLKAHDPDNECRIGDLVRVVESRPLSRDKRWRLVEIVKRAG